MSGKSLGNTAQTDTIEKIVMKITRIVHCENAKTDRRSTSQMRISHIQVVKDSMLIQPSRWAFPVITHSLTGHTYLASALIGMEVLNHSIKQVNS